MVKKYKTSVSLGNDTLDLWVCVKRLFHAHRVFLCYGRDAMLYGNIKINDHLSLALCLSCMSPNEVNVATVVDGEVVDDECLRIRTDQLKGLDQLVSYMLINKVVWTANMTADGMGQVLMSWWEDMTQEEVRQQS